MSHGANRVDLNRSPEEILADHPDPGVSEHTGVGDESVEPPVRPEDMLVESGRRIWVRDIGSDWIDHATGRPQFLGSFLQPVILNPADQNNAEAIR
jgi:hypothetical protein